jgi:hypothetical protein
MQVLYKSYTSIPPLVIYEILLNEVRTLLEYGMLIISPYITKYEILANMNSVYRNRELRFISELPNVYKRKSNICQTFVRTTSYSKAFTQYFLDLLTKEKYIDFFHQLL